MPVVPLLEQPLGKAPWSRRLDLGEMTLPAGCVGASVCSLTKIIPSPLCLCLGASSEPTCGLSSMGPEWSQAWPGRWEARGQALSCRRPGDRLQASWLCPSSFGRPVSPHPANFRPHPPSFSTSSARTSVCSGNVAPSLPQRGFFPWCWLLCPNPHPWSSLWGVGLQGLLSSVPAWLWGLTLVPCPGPCLPPRAPAPCHLPSSCSQFMAATQPEPLGHSGLGSFSAGKNLACSDGLLLVGDTLVCTDEESLVKGPCAQVWTGDYGGGQER